jgi:hypothetical protein
MLEVVEQEQQRAPPKMVTQLHARSGATRQAAPDSVGDGGDKQVRRGDGLQCDKGDPISDG